MRSLSVRSSVVLCLALTSSAFAGSELVLKLTSEAVVASRSAGYLPVAVQNLSLTNPTLSAVFHAPTDSEKLSIWSSLEMGSYFVLRCDESDGEAIVSLLSPDTEIEEIEIAGEATSTVLPDDYSGRWDLGTMHLPQAWDFETNSGIEIAIIDSGCDLGHSDLIDNRWINSGEDLNGNGIPDDYNGVDDDGNGFVDDIWGYDFCSTTYADALPGEDSDGVRDGQAYPDIATHGTHVSGIACAVTDNSTGIASSSWNAKFIPLKAMTARPGGASGSYPDIAAAVNYAVNNNARIINMSLGGYGYSSTLETACQYAELNEVLVVAAAGNDETQDLHYPAAYPSVLAVASTTSSDALSSFSNYGTWIDLCAPGSSIYSTLDEPNSYGNKSGTSMASPNVAAIAALVWGYDPSFSLGCIRNALGFGCVDIDPQNPGMHGLMGSGRLDAYQVFEYVDDFGCDSPHVLDITVDEPRHSATGDGITFSASVDGFYEVTGAWLELTRDGVTIPYSMAPSGADTWSVDLPVDAGHNYSYRCTAVDGHGLEGQSLTHTYDWLVGMVMYFEGLGFDLQYVFDHAAPGLVVMLDPTIGPEIAESVIVDDRSVIVSSIDHTLLGDGSSDFVFKVINGAQLTLSSLGVENQVGRLFDVRESELILQSCILENANSSGDGGGIRAEHSSITVQGGAIRNNMTTGSGGAIFADDSDLSFSSCTVSGNTAFDGVGGIYATQTPPRYIDTITFDKLTLTDNNGSGTGSLSTDNLYLYNMAMIFEDVDGFTLIVNDADMQGDYQAYIRMYNSLFRLEQDLAYAKFSFANAENGVIRFAMDDAQSEDPPVLNVRDNLFVNADVSSLRLETTFNHSTFAGGELSGVQVDTDVAVSSSVLDCAVGDNVSVDALSWVAVDHPNEDPRLTSDFRLRWDSPCQDVISSEWDFDLTYGDLGYRPNIASVSLDDETQSFLSVPAKYTVTGSSFLTGSTVPAGSQIKVMPGAKLCIQLTGDGVVGQKDGPRTSIVGGDGDVIYVSPCEALTIESLGGLNMGVFGGVFFNHAPENSDEQRFLTIRDLKLDLVAGDVEQDEFGRVQYVGGDTETNIFQNYRGSKLSLDGCAGSIGNIEFASFNGPEPHKAPSFIGLMNSAVEVKDCSFGSLSDADLGYRVYMVGAGVGGASNSLVNCSFVGSPSVYDNYVAIATGASGKFRSCDFGEYNGHMIVSWQSSVYMDNMAQNHFSATSNSNAALIHIDNSNLELQCGYNRFFHPLYNVANFIDCEGTDPEFAYNFDMNLWGRDCDELLSVAENVEDFLACPWADVYSVIDDCMYPIVPHQCDNWYNEPINMLAAGKEAEADEHCAVAAQYYMDLCTQFPADKHVPEATSRLKTVGQRYAYSVDHYDAIRDGLFALAAISENENLHIQAVQQNCNAWLVEGYQGDYDTAKNGLLAMEAGETDSKCLAIIYDAQKELSTYKQSGGLLAASPQAQMSREVIRNQNVHDLMFSGVELASGNSEVATLPREFAIAQAYPNPFNPVLSIELTVPREELVNVSVFNLIGQRVAVLLNEKVDAGSHTLRFDGSSVASGMYIVRAEAGKSSDVRKVMLLK